MNYTPTTSIGWEGTHGNVYHRDQPPQRCRGLATSPYYLHAGGQRSQISTSAISASHVDKQVHERGDLDELATGYEESPQTFTKKATTEEPAERPTPAARIDAQGARGISKYSKYWHKICRFCGPIFHTLFRILELVIVGWELDNMRSQLSQYNQPSSQDPNRRLRRSILCTEEHHLYIAAIPFAFLAVISICRWLYQVRPFLYRQLRLHRKRGVSDTEDFAPLLSPPWAYNDTLGGHIPEYHAPYKPRWRIPAPSPERIGSSSAVMRRPVRLSGATYAESPSKLSYPNGSW